jgi:hypothetical protein
MRKKLRSSESNCLSISKRLPLLEGNICVTHKEIPSTLRYPTVQYPFQKRLSLAPILSQINPVHVLNSI